MICDYDASNEVDAWSTGSVKMILNCERQSVGKRRWEASSGSVKMILICEMGQTLVETQERTGPLVDVSSTVVIVFAWCGESAQVEWCQKMKWI